MAMTIVVTGSAGHLGEALMRTLRADGREALGLDLKASRFTDRVGSIGDRAFVADSLRGARAVLHCATLHKPHVASRSSEDFLLANVMGTLVLLESALAAGVEAFVFTSTTSVFGSALTPPAGAPAAWIDETVTPAPKNIYGATKQAAETLCELFARKHRLPIVVLRTSRFFPEADDDETVSAAYELANVQVNELLNRRIDLEDVVAAHRLALDQAPRIGFGRYIVSATTPFTPADAPMLRRDAAAVTRGLFSDCEAIYAARGWRLFPHIDRVYDNRAARTALGWNPRYDFRQALDCLANGKDFRSPLAIAVGAKGYSGAA
jgi:nucleoside-diphosphate-sugar epimerase